MIESDSREGPSNSQPARKHRIGRMGVMQMAPGARPEAKTENAEYEVSFGPERQVQIQKGRGVE